MYHWEANLTCKISFFKHTNTRAHTQIKSESSWSKVVERQAAEKQVAWEIIPIKTLHLSLNHNPTENKREGCLECSIKITMDLKMSIAPLLADQLRL